MRTRLVSLVAIGIIVILSPQRLRPQSDPALTLGTTNEQAVAHFRAGVSDLQNFSFESANAHFKMAVDADPGFGLARVMWAGTAPMSQDQLTREMNRGVADATARGSANEAMLAKAYQAVALGNGDGAKALFTSASQAMPGDRLVALSVPGGLFNGDAKFYRDLVSRYPDYPLIYNNLAYTEWTAGNKEAALAAAKRQVELNPTAPNPHDTYAELLQWSGDLAGATEHYKRAASLSPRFPEGYAGLAEVEALQGHYDQARAYLNQAIANAWYPREKVGYLRQIAGTYAMEGTSPEALVKALDAAATAAKEAGDLPEAATIYSQIAATHAALGHADVAHQTIQTANSLGGTVPWNVHYFDGMAHGLLKHWTPAEDELAKLKASKGAPASRVAALNGYLLTQQGKPAEALNLLMAADTTDLIVLNNIAAAHAALGHADEAARWWTRVNNDKQLSLQDFTNVNSRRRARLALARK
jgi:tetratricopeptide (TPR) repeat protein